ncbi:hypothetical protein OsI_02157 [Oryza sativa Indica Group]|uniref:Glabrous enhancer-binding protein-like DBD domain-containing protein n=1 Tax=Oryza sativa subsp. indica TaxID=39946 RepID=B8A8X8_ORYSI|nr:hypothetical protein OsI_02157 [Oryza sativa Indica Group]
MRRRSPPPAAAQPPRPPTRAAESGEEGGDPGKDEVAAPPKGDSALPRSGSGFGSGNAAAPDGPAKSPMKPKKRVTAPPSSDHGSRENLAAGSPSNEGRTFNHSDVRDKVRSLKRRYNDVVLSGLAITKDHDLQLHELSCEIWGRSVAHAGDDKQRCLARDEQSSLARDEQKSFARDEEKSLARDEQSSLARDEQKSFARDEKSLARDEEKSLASDEQRSFDDMCKQFPLLAKEIKVLMEGQPAIMELFPRLDGDQVVAIEKKLENLRWIDMKRKKKMAVKMAKIRKGLIYKLEGAAILADGKAKKKASAQARKKPSAKQHAAAQEEEDGDLMAEAEEEVAPRQGDEEDGKGPLPQRKSKRVAALSGSICPPDPKRAKIVDAQKPGFGRKWNGNDEIMILEALVDQIRSGGNVPQEPGHPLFHELVQRLEGRTFNHSDVREKVRSLKRRYNDVVLSGLAITKDHDLQLHELSCEIWGRSVAHAGDDKQRCLARDEQSSLARDEQKSFAGDEEKSLARDEQSSLARDEQKSFARDEKSLARDEEKSLASDEQRSFDDMCKQFPLLAKEIKVLMEGQPAIMELFPRLDSDQVVAIEKKLENLRWIDMKRKKKMAVKMAKIRKGLIYKLEGAVILADGNMIR